MASLRVAVIGSGVSGLSAAYFLAPHAAVTLFEKNSRLGGHAHTARIQVADKTVDVDTGFMVYNPPRYPLLMALFRELDIPSIQTDMSFSVSLPDIEYASTFRGLFGDLRQSLSPGYLKLIYDIIRFNRAAKSFLRESMPSRDMLLGDFIVRNGFSKELTSYYLYPMMGSIWSTPAETMANYSAYAAFKFLDNHMLLNVLNKPAWRTVQGGSRVYVDALTKRLQKEGVDVRTSSPVVSVQRDKNEVTIKSAGEECFDRVIFATHADITLSLLADATHEEREALAAFRYSKNRTVLHGDMSFMPNRKSAWASWNYHTRPKNSVVSLTYYMNSLQHLQESTPVCVTLNPDREPAAGLVYGEYEYDHPVFDATARSAQDAVVSLQGKRHTYYAGAHLGFGFHEDGIASAAYVVERMGLPLRLTV